jgi:hypothetical protein
MSHMRHSRAPLVASLVACSLLSACSGSGSSASSATPPTPEQSTSGSSAPTETPESPSPAKTSTPAPVTLSFSPRSGGKHLEDCQRLEPGDDPAEFLFYPVLVKAPASVTLDGLTTEHSQGVVDAAAWVAPAGPTPETGTFKGWPPPKIVTGDSNLQWSRRVPAAGATLAPGTTYNVFLRLQVDPTPGDSEVKGIRFTFHDTGGDHTITWVAHTTFSMSC